MSVSNGVIGAGPDESEAAPEKKPGATPEASAEAETEGEAAVAVAADPEAETGPETDTETEPETAAGVAAALRGSGASKSPETPRTESEPKGAEPKGAEAEGAEGETKPGASETPSSEEPPSPEKPSPSEEATASPARPAATATATGATTGATAGSTAAAPAAASRPRFSWLRAGRTGAAATTVAAATATASGSGSGDGSPDSEATGASGDPNRISRPMVAAAAIGGVILLATPFIIGAVSGDDPKDDKSRGTAAGYTGPSTFPSGYVPTAEQDGDRAPGVKAPVGKQDTASKTPPEPQSNAVADSAGKERVADEPPPTGPREATTKPEPDSKAPAVGPTTESRSHAATTRSFSAYEGPHCSGSGTSYREHGSSKVANDGDQWTTALGGYSSNGCTGRYRSVPMSGNNNDAGNYATWSFDTGFDTAGTCRVKVYIPGSGGIRHVGGDPSYYTVHAGGSSSGAQLASFTIAQVDHLGQWVEAPNVRISGGSLSVVLHDRGKDWNSKGDTDAHHAADVIHVSCS
ncbi:hypothetical protein ACIRFH_03810 [Streptomyces sp. NPDC093586]|uniref:hypothetical protein n=1 Tax=Streptomyces sp. NPDC093586 TaxID=3366042 RepID=UPI00380C5270